MDYVQQKIFCLMGQTASGKTDLAIKLTEILPFEIISVDSGMVYKQMDIGTAKPNKDQLNITPHHLIDLLDPAQYYTVGKFIIDAENVIKQIIKNNKVPLLVGGTMLYFKALQEGINLLPESTIQIRNKINCLESSIGLNALYEQLKKIDPASASKIKPNDQQRIHRALEIYELTGKSLSYLQSSSPVQQISKNYEIINIALVHSESISMNNKIETRFNMMLKNGFMEEVKALHKRQDLNLEKPAIRMVGYRQAWEHLSCKINYNQMCEQILVATRQLAKRQKTWLKSWKTPINIIYIDNKNLLSDTIKLINLYK